MRYYFSVKQNKNKRNIDYLYVYTHKLAQKESGRIYVQSESVIVMDFKRYNMFTLFLIFLSEDPREYVILLGNK